MHTKFDRRAARDRRHRRVRKHVHGAPARPRLAVFRSLNHIAVQLIDDSAGHTLAAASTHDATSARSSVARATRRTAGAAVVGRVIAERARGEGVSAVVFDRGGYLYHGRVKALADAARDADWSSSHGHAHGSPRRSRQRPAGEDRLPQPRGQGGQGRSPFLVQRARGGGRRRRPRRRGPRQGRWRCPTPSARVSTTPAST